MGLKCLNGETELQSGFVVEGDGSDRRTQRQRGGASRPSFCGEFFWVPNFAVKGHALARWRGARALRRSLFRAGYYFGYAAFRIVWINDPEGIQNLVCTVPDVGFSNTLRDGTSGPGRQCGKLIKEEEEEEGPDDFE